MTISLNGTTGIQFPDSSLQAAAASPNVLKNRIINGAMVVDQRNAGASVSAIDGSYSLDRWRTTSYDGSAQTGKYTIQQTPSATETGYATRVAAGFTNYLAVTSSANTTVSASGTYNIAQLIEGFNSADLAWGTSSAKTVTLSFLVYSSLTGTFGGCLMNSAANYAYPFSYSIPTANTWTQISITVTGPTSGTWIGATNGLGIRVQFSLGTGTTYSGTAGSWSANRYETATSAVSVVGTSGATWYVTGVQLEQNTTATPFERRLYNQELANCQRYYQIGSNALGRWNSATTAEIVVALPVLMRANPSVAAYKQAVSMARIALAGIVTTSFTPDGTFSGSFQTLGGTLNLTVNNVGASAGDFCALRDQALSISAEL
jgi:hypothetical protein